MWSSMSRKQQSLTLKSFETIDLARFILNCVGRQDKMRCGAKITGIRKL